MAPPSATLSPSSSPRQNTIDDDTIKRKRMLSNRESARRSRMRKRKRLDDLTAQVINLRAENNLIFADINFANHQYLNMESENSVIRAQISELNHSLQVWSDVISCMSLNDDFAPGVEVEGYGGYDMIR